MSGNIRSADEKFNIIMEALKTNIPLQNCAENMG